MPDGLPLSGSLLVLLFGDFTAYDDEPNESLSQFPMSVCVSGSAGRVCAVGVAGFISRAYVLWPKGQ